MTKINRINSLADYFKLSEEYDYKDYISRGEPSRYEAITASAFRPYNEHKDFFGASHLQEFLNHVGNELTNMQRKHVLAFAQHSGLPTYLIDFTTSPLISLFFACNDGGEDPGYIHFINKRRLLPLDHIVSSSYPERIAVPQVIELWKKQFDAEKRMGMFFDFDSREFFYDYQKMTHSLLKLITTPRSDFCQSKLYASICRLCRELEEKQYATSGEANAWASSSFDDMNQDIFSVIYQAITCLDNNSETIEDLIWNERAHPEGWLDSYRLARLERWRMDGFNCREVNGELSWGALIKIFYAFAISFAHESAINSFYLPFYGTYSPPNISGRVLMQNSVFICQLHHTEMFHLNESPRKLLVTQQIQPDITIEVTNKKQLLKELDGLGINLKTIFGDHDNIAKYIKNNFYSETME